MSDKVTVVGAGLAGCEAAWQLAQQGHQVRLLEMKRLERNPAQRTEALAELVCSNSLRSANVINAVGLLKEEMRRLGSLVWHVAQQTRVPAGDAMAVDRGAFASAITEAIEGNPQIELVDEVVRQLPDEAAGPVILATGPLTAGGLDQALVAKTGAEGLQFHDALAPIVSGDSINMEVAFWASRYGKGSGADYLNCPMSAQEYQTFLSALWAAESVPFRDFEQPHFFEGCLPVEEVASRGPDTLRFGCLKPVGLTDPRTDKRPYAVVQLRQEDPHGQAFNLVGFQTKLTYPEQKRVFRLIPGLEQAVFLRHGAIHRNTYLDSPNVLGDQMQLLAQPNLRLAGQITGVEGYVESAAHGLLTALLLGRALHGQSTQPPPRNTALGALWSHVRGATRLPGRPHEPQNVNWGMFPPLAQRVKKVERKAQRVREALASMDEWAQTQAVELSPSSITEDALEGFSRKRRRA